VRTGEAIRFNLLLFKEKSKRISTFIGAKKAPIYAKTYPSEERRISAIKIANFQMLYN
jgi:hypothetical protein